MVLEHAVIDVRPGTGAQFEESVAEARPVIAASHGFVSLRPHRGIEAPDRYLLLVEWEALDNHVVGFRQSDAFARWRALIGPSFASPPVVDHLSPVDAVGPSPTIGQEAG